MTTEAEARKGEEGFYPESQRDHGPSDKRGFRLLVSRTVRE